jgi:hypothetical protein
MNCILIALFLFVLILRGGGSPTFLLFLELITGSIVILATGFTLFTIVKVKDLQSKGLIFLLTGTLISSLLVYLISTSLNISAGYSFLCLSVVIFSYVMMVNPRSFLENVILRYDKADLIVLTCLMGFTLLWCWQIAGSFPTLLTKGVLSTWVDAYYHGAQIAQFSDMKAVGQGDILLAGEPAFSYHRAIYVLPAVISQAANLSGLAGLTALLLPIGFLLLAVITYCFCTQLANRRAGILGVIFLLVLPDNSWLGLKNGFLGFRYVIQVAPGTSYGLAGCLLSALFFVQWLRDKSIKTALLAIFFAGSVYFFRVHFFILYFPALITAMLCAIYAEKKYFWYAAGLLSSFTLILMCVFLANKSAVFPFLQLVHLERGTTVYTDFYKYIVGLNQPVWMILTGVILLISGILGIGVVIYPLLLWIKVRRFGWESIDYFPLILLLSYIGIVLFAPAIYSDVPDELQHRPSGLLYAIVIIFSIFYATKIVDKHKWKPFSIHVQSVFIMVVAAGIIWSSLQPNNHPMRILFRGYSLYQDYQVPLNSNVIKTATFLQKKAVPGEIFLTSKNDADLVNVDTAVVVVSISGMPSYLGEQTVQTLRANASTLSVIRHRDSVIRQSIIDAPNCEVAFNRMRTNHISWYIALAYPKWDRHARASDFKSGSMAIYHVLNV